MKLYHKSSANVKNFSVSLLTVEILKYLYRQRKDSLSVRFKNFYTIQTSDLATIVI